MKHELRQFLEKVFQSYDDLKGLSERLKTSASAIETMLAPDSQNDVNLVGVNKSAANLILSALFQGKTHEPYNGKASNTKEITLDLSQPIKELKRFNKQLNKLIELQAEIKENKSEFKIEKTRPNVSRALSEFFEKEKNEAIAKDFEKRNAVEKVTTEQENAVEKVTTEQENMGALWLLDEVLRRTKEIKNEACESDILTRDLAEGQNIIVTILKKRLQNGNI